MHIYRSESKKPVTSCKQEQNLLLKTVFGMSACNSKEMA